VRRFTRSELSRLFPPGVVPGLVAVGLMIIWAAYDGGYFPGTWYWGALATLALLTVTVVGLGSQVGLISRAVWVALIAFGLYVLWSYLSMTWAQYPGAALEGSNRALLFVLVFALFVVVPWTVEAALAALILFVLGVGTMAIVITVRLATRDHIAALFISGRLASPLGYYNASAALFTMAALVAIALAVRRELPVALRAFLLAIAADGLQLALIGQSRGWLFTLPLVALAAIAVLSGRLRVVLAAAVPVLATLAVVHPLLNVFQASNGGNSVGRGFSDAAMRAGRDSLVACAAVLILGALMALADSRLPPIVLSASRRRAVGIAVAAAIVVVSAVGATAATHGRPFHYLSTEWNGFSHQETYTRSAPSSNFAEVGSGRYDFWRVGLDAFLAHPVGGLGQDNFLAYYLRHRRTTEQPEWTHSLEIRLLVHTGFVGFGLFVTFLIAALLAAVGAFRRAAPLPRAVAGAALLPLIVWAIHGSVDWFWEFPALSGPALGFLGMATALARPSPVEANAGGRVRAREVRVRLPVSMPTRIPAVALRLGGALAVLAAAAVLAVPYLAVAEIARANAISAGDPVGALSDFARAAGFNPLSADAALDGGVLALETGRYSEAEERFRQAISREPGALWEAWLGEGLAASALGRRAQAQRDFLVSRSINPLQPVTGQALTLLRTRSPLSPGQGLRELAQQD
jgi:hypothetical protein